MHKGRPQLGVKGSQVGMSAQNAGRWHRTPGSRRENRLPDESGLLSNHIPKLALFIGCGAIAKLLLEYGSPVSQF
jgi:hypothetical protein